jgi:flagellar basal-body rod protein FlgC
MSLFGSIAVSASGMEAQRIRMELIAQNLSNAETTQTPEGGPYRRKDAVFSSAPIQSTFAGTLSQTLGEIGAGGSQGVTVSSVAVDQSDPEWRYLPSHPDADAEGYVAFPNISPMEEMVNMMSASRGFEANVAAISTVKDMIGRSLELFK